MKRTITTIAMATLLVVAASAQVLETEAGLKKVKTDLDPGWQKGGLFSLAFSQVSLSNWAAGGQNSISGNGFVSLYANYGKGTLAWNNTLDLGYGMLKQGKGSTIKTDDKLDFMSKAGLKASENWLYTGLVNFKTQLTEGYKSPTDKTVISAFLAPAYLLGAIGMDYKGVENLSLFMAPITGRITIVNDDKLSAAGAFGVTPGNKSRSEFGGYIRAAYKKDLMQNISFQTKADFFSNYLKNPQNIDVNWETLILMKVNKFITVSLATHLIYDDDVMINIDSNNDGTIDMTGPRTQFKEVLGVGLSYKF